VSWTDGRTLAPCVLVRGPSLAQIAAEEHAACQKADTTRRVIKSCVVPGDPGYQRPEICYQADVIRAQIAALEADMQSPQDGNRHARRSRVAKMRELIQLLRSELDTLGR